MKRLAWITDPHLNFLNILGVARFSSSLAELEADAYAITGDIGEAPDVTRHLQSLHDAVQRPIYFVLGNHDFYRGSFTSVRERITELCKETPNLHWMCTAGVIPLTETTCLVGHDGWADARHGDFRRSEVLMNDWVLIEDLASLDREALLAELRNLGEQTANHFQAILPEALANFEHVLVLMHVPPFPEACLWEGKVTGANWLPHVCCGAAGDALREVMESRADRSMTVLCGHTHHPADVQILPNLRVITGGAEYYYPGLDRILEVDGRLS